MQVRIGVADLPQKLAQVGEEIVGDMKMAPAARVTDRREVRHAAGALVRL
jgi:hypothetical protein